MRTVISNDRVISLISLSLMSVGFKIPLHILKVVYVYIIQLKIFVNMVESFSFIEYKRPVKKRSRYLALKIDFKSLKMHSFH